MHIKYAEFTFGKIICKFAPNWVKKLVFVSNELLVNIGGERWKLMFFS